MYGYQGADGERLLMIGKHYDLKHYNCAHFVAEWYQRLGIEIPKEGVFELSFLVWMRKHFTRVKTPVDNCLVLMTLRGERHIGVYANYGVYHNYKIGTKHGSVVHWDIGVINRNYDEVTYWVWSPSDIIKTP